MKFPFVSIILVSYNSKLYFNECFSSIREIEYPRYRYEVILVDNNSRDGSSEYVKEAFKWVRLLQLDKNYGVDAALNKGVEISKGKYVVFLNLDTVVEKKWLIELVKVMETDKKIAACGSKALYYDNRGIINTIGGFWSVFGFSGSLGEGKNKNEFTDLKEVFFPSGCSMIVRRDAFLSVGGFDEDYFMYVEEPDITWKLWNLGYKTLFVPSSVMYHKVSVSMKKTGGGFKPLMYYHTTKNRLATIIKNARLIDIFWMLPLSMGAHFFEAFLFLFKLRLDNFVAVIRGILWVFINLPMLVRKRALSVHNDEANKKMIGILESIYIFINKFRKHF